MREEQTQIRVADELRAVEQRIEIEPLIAEFANSEPVFTQIAYEDRAEAAQIISLKNSIFKFSKRGKKNLNSRRFVTNVRNLRIHQRRNVQIPHFQRFGDNLARKKTAVVHVLRCVLEENDDINIFFRKKQKNTHRFIDRNAATCQRIPFGRLIQLKISFVL